MNRQVHDKAVTALLLSVGISSFLSSFMGNALNIAVPFIAADYAVAPETITWVINGFLITSAAFLLPATALANYLGFTVTYRLGALCAALTSFSVPLAPTFLTLVLFRALQGMAFALPFCTGMALVFALIPRERRAVALAICISSVYAGITVAPLISGLITEHLGWEAIFALGGTGQALGWLLALRLPRLPAHVTSLPAVRMGVCFAGIALTLLSLSALNESALAYGGLFGGLALTALYLIMEGRAHIPVLPLRPVLSNQPFSLSLFVAFLNFVATFAIGMLLSLHLQLICHLSASLTGLIMMTQPVVMLIGSALSPVLTRLLGVHRLTLLGIGMMTSGCAGFIFLTPDSLWLVIVMQIIVGLGNGIFSPPNANIIMSAVDKSLYALASSLQSLVRTTGMALSMALVTLLLNAVITAKAGSALYLEELSSGIGYIFIISTSVCALATLTNLYVSATQLKTTPVTKE